MLIWPLKVYPACNVWRFLQWMMRKQIKHEGCHCLFVLLHVTEIKLVSCNWNYDVQSLSLDFDTCSFIYVIIYTVIDRERKKAPNFSPPEALQLIKCLYSKKITTFMDSLNRLKLLHKSNELALRGQVGSTGCFSLNEGSQTDGTS